MGSIVVAICGENANGILECQSRRFLDLLEPLGFEGHVLRMGDADFIARLSAVIDRGVHFAWGYAGVGAQMAVGDRSIWSMFKVPFISVLADAPFIMPPNHCVASPYVVNGYIYREWLDFQNTHIRSRQIAALLPHGVIPNPHRHHCRWAERPSRMLFIKTGGDPERQRQSWERWPAPLRPVLHDCAAMLASADPGPIEGLVRDCLAAHDLVLDGCKAVLFGLMHELDTYVRALRATTVARALLDLPADIVGDGWDHVRTPDARARFYPAIHASALEEHLAQAQILLNTTPNFSSGAHERVLRGFAARAVVASDNNDFATETLGTLPSYHGFTWHAADLPERLEEIFHGSAADDDMLDEAEDFVIRSYDPARFLSRMDELAQLTRMNAIMSGYGIEPSAVRQ